MISVERVLEYSKLNTEENLESDTPPPPSWPQNGKIVAKNARLRYGPNLPWVFHGLNFVINGREKVRYCSTLNYMSLIFESEIVSNFFLVLNMFVKKWTYYFSFHPKNLKYWCLTEHFMVFHMRQCLWLTVLCTSCNNAVLTDFYLMFSGERKKEEKNRERATWQLML